MKKLISVIAILCLLCSFTAYSFADEVTNTYIKNVPVNVSIDAGTFSVSVPMGAINLDSTTNGTPQSYTIENKGNLPVVVKDISITKSENNGWSQIDNNAPFTNYKQFKIEVSGESAQIAANSTCSCQYTVSVPPIQPKTLTNETIANIMFTITVDEQFAIPESNINPESDTPTDPSDSTVPTPLISQNNANPSTILFSERYFYKIATFGEYTLLLLETPISDTVFEISNVQISNVVGVDDTNPISLPKNSAEQKSFELSSDEFEKYNCSIISSPDHPYMLRYNKVYINNDSIIDYNDDNNYYHRYAIWVLTSSLPTT